MIPEDVWRNQNWSGGATESAPKNVGESRRSTLCSATTVPVDDEAPVNTTTVKRIKSTARKEVRVEPEVEKTVESGDESKVASEDGTEASSLLRIRSKIKANTRAGIRFAKAAERTRLGAHSRYGSMKSRMKGKGKERVKLEVRQTSKGRDISEDEGDPLEEFSDNGKVSTLKEEEVSDAVGE